MVRVVINGPKFDEARRMLAGVEKGYPRAVQAAISRAIKPTAIARIARRIAETVNLRVKTIKEQIKAKLPSFNNFVGVITVLRKAVPLIEYLTAGQRGGKGKRGLRVRVRKSGAMESFPESFVGTMKSGHRGVYRREVRGGLAMAFGGEKRRDRGQPTSIRVPRLPIEERFGPTVVGVMANAPGKGAPTIVDEEMNALGADVAKNLDSQVKRFLAGK